jgi:hypothetical protein
MVPSWDPKKGEVRSFAARGKQMDWIGSVLEIGACVAGVMAISFGGTIYLWGSGQTIALFVTSAVLFILFALQQTFCFMTTPEERIFPIQFMRNKDMLLLWLITAAVAGAVLVYQPVHYCKLARVSNRLMISRYPSTIYPFFSSLFMAMDQLMLLFDFSLLS